MNDNVFQVILVVIGAFLAVAGGIIGTVFTNILHKHKEKREFKRDAYTRVLYLLNSFDTIDSVDVNDFQKDNCEALTKMMLYSSDTVKEIMTIILLLIKEMQKTTDNLQAKELFINFKDILNSQMKIELNTSNKADRNNMKNYGSIKREATEYLKKGKNNNAD